MNPAIAAEPPSRAGHPPITRAFIQKRLAAQSNRGVVQRGDAATTQRLLEAGGVAPAPRRFEQPMTATPEAIPSLVPAAVLVPLVEYDSGFSVILTVRTAGLKAHASQIAFPGGRVEASDSGMEAAALRELTEEIGVTPEQIEILGRLDLYRTVTGFEVTPIVGALKPPVVPVPDPVEVAEVFEVPLAFFLDPANHQRHSRTLPNGTVRAYYAMPFGDRYIWGATAGMLLNLYEVLTAPPS